MARALQGPAGPAVVLLAYVLLLAVGAPSFAAGKQNYLSGKHCQRTFRNCARCTPGYKECSTHFFIGGVEGVLGRFELKGKTCERKTQQQDDLSGPKCKALDANCALCTPGFKSCAQCATNYAFDATMKKCVEDLSGPKCQNLFPNCVLCTAGFKSCAQCPTEYAFDATTKKCVEDLSGLKCQSLFTNCAMCTSKFQACAACAGSFVLNPDFKHCESAKKAVDFTVFLAGGGSGEIAGVATILFPGGSFDVETSAHMEVVDDAAAERLYTETSVFFKPQQRGPSFGIITVTVGDQQPRKDPTVTLTIPNAVALNASSDEEARLMFLNKLKSDIASLDTWEVTNEGAFPVATVGFVTATLPFTAFYQLSPSGKYVASLLLITTNTVSAGATRRRLSEDLYDCSGVNLKRPVDAPIRDDSQYGQWNLNLAGEGNSHFSNFHTGVDFTAPTGTRVLAAIDGKVELGSQDGGKSGWGHYIIVRGAAGTTLYAHLPPHEGNAVVKDGDAVKAGDQIGVSGNSGTSFGQHLHFEYAPAGDIFDQSIKVDPFQCFYDFAPGSITFRDDTPWVADASFEVRLEGHFICQTSIGDPNACTLGALRRGLYTLSVTCLDAKNGDCKLSVIIFYLYTKLDGKSFFSAVMKKFETLTFTLMVT